MQVVAGADARRRRAAARARRGEIVRRRDLHVRARRPARSRTGVSRPLGQHRLVGRVDAARAERNGRVEHGAPKSLRRLRQPDLVARNRLGDDAPSPASTRFTVSRAGTAGTAAPVLARAGDHAIDQRRVRRTAAPRRERARRRRRPATPPRRARTESCRRAPPATHAARPRASARRARRRRRRSSAGSTTTSSLHRRMRVERRDAALQHASGRRGRATASGVARPAASPAPGGDDDRLPTRHRPVDSIVGRVRGRRADSTARDARPRQSRSRARSTAAGADATPARRSRPARGSSPSSPSSAPSRTSDCRTARSSSASVSRPADVHGVLADARVLLARPAQPQRHGAAESRSRSYRPNGNCDLERAPVDDVHEAVDARQLVALAARAAAAPPTTAASWSDRCRRACTSSRTAAVMSAGSAAGRASRAAASAQRLVERRRRCSTHAHRLGHEPRRAARCRRRSGCDVISIESAHPARRSRRSPRTRSASARASSRVRPARRNRRRAPSRAPSPGHTMNRPFGITMRLPDDADRHDGQAVLDRQQEDAALELAAPCRRRARRPRETR